jgi:hypothetical protein
MGFSRFVPAWLRAGAMQYRHGLPDMIDTYETWGRHDRNLYIAVMRRIDGAGPFEKN